MYLCNYPSLTLLIVALFKSVIFDKDSFYMTTNQLRRKKKEFCVKLNAIKGSI